MEIGVNYYRLKERVEWGGERKRQGLKPNEKRVKPGGREDREG